MTTTPRLLVSVRDVREADAAWRGGADVIDVKNPDAGPLGMASMPTIHAILEHLGDARPVTAALGELHERPLPTSDAPALLNTLRHVKLGLAHAPPDWRDQLDAHLAAHGRERFIAAAYADQARIAAPPVEEVLTWAVERRAAGLLIDTAIKDRRGLTHWCSLDALARFIETARRHALLIALAGSLDDATIEQLAPLGPDIIAVRTAACDHGQRTARVSDTRVSALKTLLTTRSAATPRPTNAQRAD